jgi:chromosome segregation ATPase
MESGKNRADRKIEVLSGEVDSLNSLNNGLMGEFNQMKNEMHLSSAKKDSHIDSLNIFMVKDELNNRKKDADVEDQIYAFQTEKRQLKQAISKNKKKITEMSGMIKAQLAQIALMKNEAVELKFQLNNQKDATTAVENSLKLKEKQIANKTDELNKLNSELTSLKEEGYKKDQKIEKLSNQVKLLKKELGM